MDTFDLISETPRNKKPPCYISQRCKTAMMVLWAVTMTATLLANISLTIHLLHSTKAAQHEMERRAGSVMVDVLRYAFDSQNTSSHVQTAAAQTPEKASYHKVILDYLPQDQLSKIQGSCRGQKGDQGLSSKGDNGAKGDAGIKGVAGSQGFDGLAGVPGTAGKKGDQGLQGSRGPKGDLGLQGVKGASGSSGSPGPNGAPGIMGLKGDLGVRGEPGAQGSKGGQGTMGAKSEAGLKGEMGDKGEKGARGYAGLAALVSGSVRLGGQRSPGTSGASIISGRLEVYTGRRGWGYVCDDGPDDSIIQSALDKIGQVVCRDLGGTLASIRMSHDVPNDNFALDNVSCTGTELNLMECRHNTPWDDNCSSSEGIYASCNI